MKSIIDFNEEELRYQYTVNKHVMTKPYLYRLIDLLLESNDRMLRTLEDISQRNQYRAEDDVTSEQYNEDAQNQRDDMD